jgi:hypothetical protein
VHRYIATFTFYRAGMPRAATRLANHVEHVDAVTLDEPATARALARHLQRGLICGAVGEEELASRTGLDADALAELVTTRG